MLCIVGYVGVDVVVVVLFEEFGKFEDLVLIVDVGINVELLFGNKDCVLVCLLLMGLVFEGV